MCESILFVTQKSNYHVYFNSGEYMKKPNGKLLYSRIKAGTLHVLMEGLPSGVKDVCDPDSYTEEQLSSILNAASCIKIKAIKCVFRKMPTLVPCPTVCKTDSNVTEIISAQQMSPLNIFPVTNFSTLLIICQLEIL